MQLKGHRVFHLLISVGFPLLLLAVFQISQPAAAAPAAPAAQPVQYIAFIGSDVDIEAHVAPFYYNKTLRFVRVYYDAISYLDEAPFPFFPAAYPQDLSIRLYKLMVPPIDVTQTISDLHDAIKPVSDTVKISTDEMQFLSFLPDQVVVHGECDAMDNLDVMYSIMLKEEIKLDYLSITPTPCIHLYEVPSIMVDVKIAEIISGTNPPSPPFYPDVWAERNYLSSSYMGGHYTFGSGGVILDGAPGPNVPASPLTTSGNNVRVVIYDTSPYQIEFGELVTDVGSLPIKVRHDVSLPPGLPAKDPAVANIGAHGTMVATPIVLMAPSAEVILQRVLDEQGIGDSFTLYQAIDKMLQEHVLAANNDLDGVVFNYSLGVDIEDNPQQSAFYRLLTYVNQKGIVQVGASGNGSAFANAIQPMTLPAAHPNVIGIAALGENGVIACYSNTGDFAVPGGGAARGAAACNMEEMVEVCAYGSHTDCAAGWDPNSTVNGWSWSVGTSFAAPIVSGLVAQIIEALSAPRAAASSAAPQMITPAQVLAQLEEQATASENSGASSGVLFSQPVTSAVSGLRSSTSAEGSKVVLLLIPLFILVLGTFLFIRAQRD